MRNRGEVRKDIANLIQNERIKIFNNTITILKKKFLNESPSDANLSLENLFENLCLSYKNSSETALLLSTLQGLDNLNDKINFFARFVSEKSKLPSENLIINSEKFLAILNNDNDLNSFIANPQAYLDSHRTTSAYNQQILQSVINDPKFNSLPSVHRVVAPNTFIYTPLTKAMYQLHLPDYASTDAARFPQCINEDAKESILEKAKKDYYGPPVIGTGALPNYNRKAIEQTAKHVKKLKMGECHSFAQLAADHFLNLIDSGQLPPMHIKMVSHNHDLGSHTFLLIDHNSDDLNELANCLIVDPWAVAMGHVSTYGIYTKDNYPFSGMLTQLTCCYDNQVPEAKQNLSEHKACKPGSGYAITPSNFFTRLTTSPKEIVLSREQKAAIDFLNTLAQHTGNSVKRDLMKELVGAVKTKEIAAKKGVTLGTLAFYARAIEKDADKYLWKNLNAMDDSLLSLFNQEPIHNLWLQLAKKNNLAIPPSQQIDVPALIEIVRFLNTNEDHTFSLPAKHTNNVVPKCT
ncbi:Uncharacterised protein [Legionella beliardensis]|uniref:Uncharacterized protein n=1 Tax=Legionella beliardensis TaxID=91822 RepID=A0A378I2H2_9GAMM|nr:hypothetical protein [Legionella beliardensis]STX28856.1 Uncharacterised protein [Legionella beliardensis]